MEKSVPSRLSNLRELLQTLSVCFQIQTETAAILEDYERRVYSLEEDRRRLIADYKAQEQRIQSLEKRYSDLLYNFSALRQEQK